jgi:hypothetical protein
VLRRGSGGLLGAGPEYLPHGRTQAGDRHLKFHETRDNLQPLQGVYTDELVGSVVRISAGEVKRDQSHPRRFP